MGYNEGVQTVYLALTYLACTFGIAFRMEIVLVDGSLFCFSLTHTNMSKH